MKQYIKERCSYHHTIILFYFFTCDDLLFNNNMQKTLKPSKKMFQFPGWMTKNFIDRNFSWRVLMETWDASWFKEGLLEKEQECSKNLSHIATEKYIFSGLNRSIFQISLKYIKLVISKILFILVLCNFLTPSKDFSETVKTETQFCKWKSTDISLYHGCPN